MSDRSSSGPPPQRIVIVGGGFAGLAAAQQLKHADPAEVTLVDRRNHHLFQPLLYQVATGELSPANIASPIRGILRKQRNARVLLDEVTGIDLSSKQIALRSRSLPFDYLIVASGSSHSYFGNESWKEIAPGLKSVENATEIRRRLLNAFEMAEAEEDPERVRQWLTFVIVGAGPTGCELAGALAEVAYHTMAKDFRRIDPRSARIVLVEPAPLPLSTYPSPLPQRAKEALERLGVEVINGYLVTDVNEHGVKIKSVEGEQTEEIQARSVVWAAGVAGSPLGKQLCEAAELPVGRAGRVAVNPDCSLPGHPHIFVVGDLAIFEDKDKGELPGLAPVASQMGRHAADCLLRDLQGGVRKPFQYFDKGSMAVIGRYHAVGSVGKLKFHGFLAWALWLFVHLFYINRFRNRLLVSIQWGWAFFTHDRASRLITNPQRASESK
jgi:NADH dehydrogenase